MKTIVVLIILIGVSFKGSSQIKNADFELWHYEQPVMWFDSFENLAFWETNNEQKSIGPSTTPVEKIEGSNGFLVNIESKYRGIDALGPGLIRQKIGIENIESIEFESKCDSLSDKGRCVISISDELGNFLYIDSISIEDTDFVTRSISITDNWRTNDSVTIEFQAYGNLFALDPENDGYSIFQIDNIRADLISNSTRELEYESIKVFPNPAINTIWIESNFAESSFEIELMDCNGKVLKKMVIGNAINIEELNSGVYILKISGKTIVTSKLVMVQK